MNVYIPPIIEKVQNGQGSTAGAGSGEYHRYRAMRRRERTRIAAMEKEYDERKQQKDFEDKKERRKEKLETERDRKRKRRNMKESKKKLIQQIVKEGTNNVGFRKDIPLIDQIKSELGEEEFIKVHQEKSRVEDFEFTRPSERKFRMKKNRDIVQNNVEVEKNENDEVEERMKKLFPTINKSSFEYETFDDYDESLDIKDMLKRINDENSNKKVEEPVKYKEIEQNIIIHDCD
jgi:hypothetical protein